MLTSKPPFQSSTTDEIYRRAKDRDYEWPSSGTAKYISQEAKDLVATMLQDADQRPDPDTIVAHPFFTSGYMPLASDITHKLRELAPENSAFYERLSAQAEPANTRNVQDMCRECGVGPWCQSQLVFRNIWREMAEEEQNGLTPVIPLAEGIVYRPFDEIKNEQKLQARLAAQQQTLKHSTSQPLPDKPDERRALPDGAALSRKPSTGLLRVPPQSFAAQQRAQHRPAAPSTTTTTTTTATTLRSRTTPDLAPAPASRTVALRPRPGREPSSTPSTDDMPPPRISTRSLRSALPSARSQPLPSTEPTPVRRSASVSKSTSSPAAVVEDRLSLFSPTEYQESVPGTQPDVVLERLQKLQAELERALNARTMALVSARDKTPAPPCVVVKWVDYTNKFGLGYVLNDGSVGCILRGIPAPETSGGVLPPACLLVHGAERHCLRKDDKGYEARHQIVPMREGIWFYENNGEGGISRVRVAPENFVVPVAADGTVGKLSAGRDIYDHRKRERVVLWKKFANYMIAYGRDVEREGASPTEGAIPVPTITDPTAAPADVVTFYQRFGDVGCWMFADGHMQVSLALFPHPLLFCFVLVSH